MAGAVLECDGEAGGAGVAIDGGAASASYEILAKQPSLFYHICKAQFADYKPLAPPQQKGVPPVSHPAVRPCVALKRHHEAKWKTVLVSLLVGGCAVVALPSTAQAQSDGDFFRCLVAGAYGVDDMGDRAGQVMSMNDGLPRLRAAMDSLAAETGETSRALRAGWIVGGRAGLGRP